ncbi:MAG: hypothetical protein HY910_17575 [Desulfarculus sp.]|nr:hypothetical protein [Desulfarculus sp.]
MKKIASATALIVALAIPGLALASAPKVGDKLNLCEKQGAYTLMQAKDKCDGNKVDGSLKAIKDGKMEVDVKGKKVMVDLPKAVDSKATPAKAMPASALKAEPTKAPETKAAIPAPAVKAEPTKTPETKAAPDKTVTPAAPEKK